MAQHRLLTVDVFTAHPLRGNPVAVVLDADRLADADMQRIAAWTNLSETTFVLPPTARGADYRLRIFTPRAELPFAGHPSVGSAHAVLHAGVVPPDRRALVQECGAGLVPVRIEDSLAGRTLFVRVPAARVRADAPVDAEALGRALGAAPAAPPLVADVGVAWVVAPLAGEDAVRALRPDAAAVASLSERTGAVGVTVFAPGGASVVVRSFAPLSGIVEDPVCGSGNAAVAAYVAATGRLERWGRAWMASQGREVGRDGRVAVRVDDAGEAIEIGGAAVTVVEGRLLL